MPGEGTHLRARSRRRMAFSAERPANRSPRRSKVKPWPDGAARRKSDWPKSGSGDGRQVDGRQRASEVLLARVWDQYPTLLIACSICVSRFAVKDDERTVELADRDILHRKDQHHSSREKAQREAQRCFAKLASPLIPPDGRADQSEQKEMHSHNGVGYAPLAISRLSWVRARFCKRETCICEMLSCFATSA